MWMLGAAMTVPFLLLGGPLAGYCLGQLLLVNYFAWPAIWGPISIVLGFVAAAMQVYRIIKKMKDSEK